MQTAENTAFATPERAAREVIVEQYKSFVGTHCRAFFDTLPTMVMALNCYRQVVFANRAAIEFLGSEDVEQVLGKRPGEAFGCINAHVSLGGCGTSRHCRNCGAVQAILAAVDGVVGNGQCKLLRREQSFLEGLDLHVNASPLAVSGQQFIIFAVTDVSHEMRRRSMERIFFHDVLNLAGGINGLVEVLRLNKALGEKQEFAVLHSATQTLVDEIIAQRELLAAESNELKPAYSQYGSRALLEQLLGLYATSPAAQGQTLGLVEPCTDCVVETDVRLAQRVLGNMIKNALEAGQPGDTVTLACEDDGDALRFLVHNSAVIPETIQVNIFHRRFSTKAESRGLGTYSMLLLAERYLLGSVGFSSAKCQGTTFFLRLPKRLESA